MAVRLPKVRLRAIPVFPTDVTGRTAIEVVKISGRFYIDLNASTLSIAAVQSEDVNTTYALALGSITDENPKGSYSLVPFAGFQGNSADITSLAEQATIGIVVRAGEADYFTRTLVPGTGIGITNANGTGGNITIAINDAELLAFAGLTSAADRVPYYTGLGTAALATFTAAGRALVDDADAAAQRVTLALVPGVNVQVYADILNALTVHGTDTAFPVFTGGSTVAMRTLTAQLPLHVTNGNGVLGDPDFTIDAATTLAAGSMSAADKAKLDGIASGATVYTNETAQDAVGGILTDTATIDFTYDDAGDQITADVKNDSITDAKLRNSAALSVIGRSANSTGDPADIAAASDFNILRRSGTAIGFGAIDLSQAGAVGSSRLPFANMVQIGPRSIVCNITNAPGDIDAIAGTANQVVIINAAGTALAWGAVNLAAAAAVTNALGAANGGTGVANNAASTITISGNFGTTFTVTATTSVTFPTSGTLATLAGVEAPTNKNFSSGTNTFPTFNQNTTGTAAALTTGRNIDGQIFDGTGNITVIAPGTHAASSKATPVDADEIPLVDSAASNALAKLTWANLKATFKTYYDAVAATFTNKTIALGSNTVSGTMAQFNTAATDGDFAFAGNNLSDLVNAATAFANIKQAATDTATGVIELATLAEALAGTDTVRALTAAGLAQFVQFNTQSIANGATGVLPAGAGLWLVIENTTTGEVGGYLVGGGTATFLFQVNTSTGIYVQGTPAATKCSVVSSGGNYHISNNIGGTKSFSAVQLKVRATN